MLDSSSVSEDSLKKEMKDRIDAIVGLFTPRELQELGFRDSDARILSFREQLILRTFGKYPSFVPIEQLRVHLKKILDHMRFSAIDNDFREFLLDEVQKGVFVSKRSHMFNLNMNSDVPKRRFNLKTIFFVDFLRRKLKKLEGLEKMIVSRYGNCCVKFSFYWTFHKIKNLQIHKQWIIKNQKPTEREKQLIFEELDLLFQIGKITIHDYYMEFVDRYWFPCFSIPDAFIAVLPIFIISVWFMPWMTW